MATPLFDAHAHVIADDWENYPPTSKNAQAPPPARTGYTVTVDSLIAMMDEHDVTAACLVQRGRLYGFDNSYIIDSAREHPGRLHPVVILDPQDPATPDRYRTMVRDDHVRGFRMQGERPWLLDPAWMCSDRALEVWQACADLGTPMTLGLFMKQLPYTLPLIRIIACRFPDLPILLDHGGMPYGMSQYEVRLAREAGEEVVLPGPPHFGIEETIAIFEDVPNVHFKITEINMERLTAANVRPAHLVRRLIDGFGPDRVVWGSDVGQSTRWDFRDKTAMARSAADFLTPDEARRFLHDNAARVYLEG
ncbi:amidohydrolase [Pseudonocardia sp. CNS-004]|nr:amidohydrolase [Pseudonocardia sp. CNS-004]